MQTAIAPAGNQKSNKRENELHTLIERIVMENPRITAKETWRMIEVDWDRDEPIFDLDGILMVVDSTSLRWKSRYGKTQTFKFTSLDSALSRIKKKITPD